MIAVFTGLSAVIVLIGLGAIAAWRGILPPSAQVVMQKLAFYFASPALLFTVMVDSDARALFTPVVGVFTLASAIAIIVMLGLGRGPLQIPRGERAILAMSSGYVNSNNMGLPISLYVIGNLNDIPGVLLVQVLVFAPLLILALQASIGGHRPLTLIGRTFTTPLILGTLLGAVVSFMQWPVPSIVWVPLEMLGGAAIPLMLLAFGASLFGRDVWRKPERARSVALASLVKVAAMPALAFVLARFAFGLSEAEVFAVTVIAALPTAQNIFTFAVTYGVGDRMVRDTIVVTSVLSLPIIAAIAWLLAPG